MLLRGQEKAWKVLESCSQWDRQGQQHLGRSQEGVGPSGAAGPGLSWVGPRGKEVPGPGLPCPSAGRGWLSYSALRVWVGGLRFHRSRKGSRKRPEHTVKQTWAPASQYAVERQPEWERGPTLALPLLGPRMVAVRPWPCALT